MKRSSKVVQPLLFQDRDIFPPRNGTSFTSTNFGRRGGLHPCTATLGVGEGCKDIYKLFLSAKQLVFDQMIPKEWVSGDGRIFLGPLSLFLTPQPDTGHDLLTDEKLKFAPRMF